MRNAQGYSVIVNPGDRPLEHDTFSCAHCGNMTFTKGMWGNMQVAVIKGDGTTLMRDVHKCFRCDEYICPRCVGKECEPKFKRIEREEREAKLLLTAGS